MTEAFAAGPTDQPLIDQTIGANLDTTAARFPDHDALVVSSVLLHRLGVQVRQGGEL